MSNVVVVDLEVSKNVNSNSPGAISVSLDVWKVVVVAFEVD